MECVLVIVGTNFTLGVCILYHHGDTLHVVFVVIMPNIEGWPYIPFMMLLNCNLIVSYIVLRPLSENRRGCLRRLIRMAKKRYFWCLVCGPTTNPTFGAV